MSGRWVSGRGPRSVRARLTAATTGVVAVAMVVGGLLLVTLLESRLLGQRDEAAREQARDVAALVTSGRLPDPVPTGGTNVVQVVDDLGRVRAASAGGDRLVPLLDPGPLARVRAGEAVELPGRRIGIDEPLRVVGVPATGPRAGTAGRAGGEPAAGERQTVLLAGPVADLRRGVAAVRTAVAVAATLLVLGTALLTRWLVGSALRPVEELTRAAAAVTGAGAGSTARLPVPDADDEVRRLAVTLDAMVERIRAAGRRQQAFVSDAAHELRSPLASIRTGLEVSLLHPDGADWPGTASDALEDAARMSRLVDDLLVLARIDEAGRPDGRAGGRTDGGQGEREHADLAAVADEVVAKAAQQATPGVAVVREGDASAPVAIGPDAATRIVANLVANAVRHARSRVVVAVAHTGTGTGGAVTLEIVDDGPGIAPEDRERVFDRFTRLDDARSRDAGGAGLGLAIVRALADAAGGSVGLHDTDSGAGLRAVVRLPRWGGPEQPSR